MDSRVNEGGKAMNLNCAYLSFLVDPSSQICLKDSVALQQNCKHFIRHVKPSSPYFLPNNILKTHWINLPMFFFLITSQFERDLIIRCRYLHYTGAEQRSVCRERVRKEIANLCIPAEVTLFPVSGAKRGRKNPVSSGSLSPSRETDSSNYTRLSLRWDT